METKKKNSSRRIRSKVTKTQAFLALSKPQQLLVKMGQNITAIHKGVEEAKANGIVHWEKFSQHSRNNSEIIRELYINNLEVNF